MGITQCITVCVLGNQCKNKRHRAAVVAITHIAVQLHIHIIGGRNARFARTRRAKTKTQPNQTEKTVYALLDR